MSRVRLTGPYRYLIYVTPDYAAMPLLRGLGPRNRARGDATQSTFWVTDHSFQIHSLVQNLNGDDQQQRNNNKGSRREITKQFIRMLVLINDMHSSHYCCERLWAKAA